MRNIRLAVLPMLLILGLLMTGFAYAHWSQTIYIEGSVASGTLDWKFTSASALDSSPGELDWHCHDNFENWEFWRGDKDVGMTTAVIEDDHTVTLTLHNVYPSYFTSVSVYVINTGTVPLNIENVVIDGHVLTSNYQKVRVDLDDDGYADIEIYWGNHIGYQLDPGDPPPEISFWIHILQEAPQGETLSFTISLVGVQWNEYP